MSWNKERSKERVAKNDFSAEKFTVRDLTRELNFANLGSREVLRANAVHLYVDVPNFHRLVRDAGNDKEAQKRLLRAASTLRKVEGDMLSEQEIAKIQMQNARAHGICYKPYDGDKEDDDAGDFEQERVLCAIKAVITLQTYVADVFNQCFPSVGNFSSAAGLDSGRFLIANPGFRGERERISLGSCANIAAKILSESGTITITERVFNLLPQCLQDEFEEVDVLADVVTYQASGLKWSTHPKLADELDVEWDSEKWEKLTEDYRDDLPLNEMEIEGAEVLIDPDKLSERKSKRTIAATLVSDIDGFTKYVAEVGEDDDETISLVRTFHMIRHELHAVGHIDYEGLVVQHRGDCMVVILHLPDGDEAANDRNNKALDIAIALQSSMEEALNEKFGNRQDLHIAVGVDTGKVLVTRLGKKGAREIFLLGPEAEQAEKLQRATDGRQIRITQEIYDSIEDEVLKVEFKKNGNSYVATGLTFPKLDQKREEKAARAGSLGAKASGSSILVITNSSKQIAPYGHEERP